ncbi:MAG: homoserine dehydrogenase [Firmicutes bacterium]|nr:homoserine dehydrogenase [Bacillota bacterium]
MAQPVRIGLLGYGTVGQAFVTLLQQQTALPAAVEVALVTDLSRPREGPAIPLTTDARDVIANPRVDLVVDVMGGRYPAYQWVREAILNGKSVVTANKEVMAYHGSELLELAYERGVHLRYEASVGGGIPLIEPLLSHFRWGPIDAVIGVLNGTTNFILSAMEKGASYEEALATAQAKGYAEADPSADVLGYDAVRKLSLIMRMVFHFEVSPDDVPCRGIDQVTVDDIVRVAHWGYRIKLIARAYRGGRAMVWPTLVPADHRLACLEDNQNSLCLYLWSQEYWLEGPGAGGPATALSVLSDVYRVIVQRQIAPRETTLPIKQLSPIEPEWVIFPVDPDREIVPTAFPEFGLWNGQYFRTEPTAIATVERWLVEREGFKAYPLL